MLGWERQAELLHLLNTDLSLMAALEKLTSKHTSRDEGLPVEDENAHPGPASPKKQKQLILIRLI